jgi:dATP pyrophosphohydrolase
LNISTNLIEAHIVRIVDNKIEYLLLQRSKDKLYPNIWQMVTGKPNINEKAYQTAIREIKEETNLTASKLFIVPHVNSFYNSFDDSINFVPVFLALVNRDENVIISAEHQDYHWVKKKVAKNLLAWPGQSTSVNIIHDYLTKKKDNLNFIEIDLNNN